MTVIPLMTRKDSSDTRWIPRFVGNPVGRQASTGGTSTAGVRVRDFLGKQAPIGYIAGLGRGALGFTTRSDLGPVLPAENLGLTVENLNDEGLLAASGPLAVEDEEADDTFALVEARMAQRRAHRSKGSAVPSSNKVLTQKKSSVPMASVETLFVAERARLDQMNDVQWESLPESGDFLAKKRAKRVDPSRERYTPLPDTLLVSLGSLRAVNDPEILSSGATGGRVLQARLDAISSLNGHNQQPNSSNHQPGTVPFNLQRSLTESRIRDHLSNSLHQTRIDSDSGSVLFDPASYLSELNASVSNQQSGDLRSARKLFKAAVVADPSNAAAWISAVRIEEVGNDLEAARTLLTKALVSCPNSEDIWKEAARLSSPEDRSSLLDRAVNCVPESSALWFALAESSCQNIVPSLNLVEVRKHKNYKTVLQRAVKVNPRCADLWKALVEAESDNPEAARKILTSAVEFCPDSVDMWLALARLESASDARLVINKARRLHPTSVAIWIGAARLEEATGTPEGVLKVIKRAVSELDARGVPISRSAWLSQAKACEESGDLLVSRSIVNCLPPLVDNISITSSDQIESSSIKTGEEQQINSFVEEADECSKLGHPHVAQSLLMRASDNYPESEIIWFNMFKLFRNSISKDFGPDVSIYEEAIKRCPTPKIFLAYANFLFQKSQSQIDSNEQDFYKKSTLRILDSAFSVHPLDIDLSLKGAKLRIKCGHTEGACQILEPWTGARLRDAIKLSENVSTVEKVIILRASLSFFSSKNDTLNDFNQQTSVANKFHTKAIEILKEAIVILPGSEKLWLEISKLDNNLWDAAIVACPNSVNIVINAAFSFAQSNTIPGLARARAVLEAARLRMPGDELLWFHSIRLERNHGSTSEAHQRALCTRALQRCPLSGNLWACAISMDPLPMRRSRINEGLSHCTGLNSSPIHVQAALFILAQDSAKGSLNPSETLSDVRRCLEHAVTADPENGDSWAYYQRFSLQFPKVFQNNELSMLKSRIERARPRGGLLWPQYRSQLKRDIGPESWYALGENEVFNRFVNEAL